MSITSLSFVIFIFVVFSSYYLIQKKFQWVLLLFASIIFYTCGGIQSSLYVIITATTIYFATILMQKLSDEQKIKENLTKEEKKRIKKKIKKKKKIRYVKCSINKCRNTYIF